MKKIYKLGISVKLDIETGNLNIENKSSWGNDKKEAQKIETAFILFMKNPVIEFLTKAGIVDGVKK